MRKLFITILMCWNLAVFAQKPSLDTSAIANWPGTPDVNISNNGDFLIRRDCENNGCSLRLETINGKFIAKFPNATGNYRFTGDSKALIVSLKDDSLELFNLKSRKVSYRLNVTSFMLANHGDGHWLAYVESDGTTILENLYNKQQMLFTKTENCRFSENGKVFLVQGLDSVSHKTWMKWIDLASSHSIGIYIGDNPGNILFNQQENALAFLTNNIQNGKTDAQVWFYQMGMASAKNMIRQGSPGVEPGYEIGGLQKFSPDGNKLFFYLKQTSDPLIRSKTGVSVDIWNYKDEYLQCDQLMDPYVDQLQNYSAVLDIKKLVVTRLQQIGDGLYIPWSTLNEGSNDDYLLTGKKYNRSDIDAIAKPPQYILVNTQTGKRLTIIDSEKVYWDIRFSPSGKYIIWFNSKKQHFMVYDIKIGQNRDVSLGIHTALGDELNDHPISAQPYGFAMSLTQDSFLLIYDRYDVWKVDPEGKTPPLNLTNGFGRKNQIVLRCVYESEGNTPVLDKSGDLILCAINEKNKENGFFKINLKHVSDPIRLSMEPEVYYFSGVSPYVSFPRKLIRFGKNRFLLDRMSSTSFPNPVTTVDFKRFHQLTNVQPQLRYNWLTSELLSWKTFKGYEGQGILYKPENFDSLKKYPIIFYYYERMSDGLNKYLEPELSSGAMNIPWFVSHGYLVFCPDIHYKPGDPGESIYDYIVSAAKMIERKSFVDSLKMGVQGHSFGGFETNYLITQTDIFAAAASGAGVTDLISNSGDAGFAGGAGQEFTEDEQLRMAVPLWSAEPAYTRNSPVFYADKVRTPLLILHNKKDGAVPWGQGVEYFTALRRLKRQSWMLQYDGEDHNLIDKKNQLDYTIRLTQFFDHFLKGAPEPKWMSQGIPARLKGIDDGLEY